MSKLPNGFTEVVISIIGGIISSAFLQAFKQGNLIPTGYFWLFIVIGFVGTLALLSSYMKAGVGFLIGWLIGAYLLRSVLSTGDFFLYFVAPIAALVIRGAMALKKSS
jgi:hypothetical protein